MKRIASMLLLAIASYLVMVSARGTEPPKWPVAAEGPSGSTWEIQPGSVVRQAGAIGPEFVGTVLHRYANASGPAANLYLMAVPVAHCDQREGSVERRSMSGEAQEVARFRHGRNTVALGIALQLCRLGKAKP